MLQTQNDVAPAVRFDDVGLRFGRLDVFQHLSFSVAPGEFVCLLGPSGCGKSTTLRLMGGLLGVREGQVTVEGDAPERAWQKIAYVFQSPRLLPWRTALGNVRLGMELRGVRSSRAALDAQAASLLEMVGLRGDASKYPRMLSGGERQRVAIARALAVDPDIILMDEPFSALDPNTRGRLRRELLQIWQRSGKTIVFVTHDIEEALLLADRVLLFSGKPTRIVETLRIDQARPRDGSAEIARLRERLHEAFREIEA